jgi:hypothetical protein
MELLRRKAEGRDDAGSGDRHVEHSASSGVIVPSPWRAINRAPDVARHLDSPSAQCVVGL